MACVCASRSACSSCSSSWLSPPIRTVSKARRFMLFALFSHLPLTWCSLGESCSAQQRQCAPASESKEARAARYTVVPQPLLEAQRVDLPEHLLAALLSQVWVEVQMVHDLSSLRLRLPTSQEAYGERRPAVMSRASRLSRELLSCIVPAPPRSRSSYGATPQQCARRSYTCAAQQTLPRGNQKTLPATRD